MSKLKKLNKEMVKKLEAKLVARLKELSDELEEDRDAFQEPLPADSKEAAPMLDDLEIIEADNERDVDEIDDIRNAIRNIHSGDYGNCDKCGGNIAVDRLLALPHALLCIDCQSKKEKDSSHT